MQHRRKAGGVARIVMAVMALVTSLAGFTGPRTGLAQAQVAIAAPQNQAAAPQSFEVASIKPSAPQAAGVFVIRMGVSPGGRWTATGVTVSMLIQQAYDIRDYQITGGPGWLTSERYDIVAKAETPDLTRETARVLLQSLLAERFSLKFHRETKELPIYELVVGKNGPKLHKSETQPAPANLQPPNPSNAGQAGVAGGGGGGAVTSGRGAPTKGGSMIRMGRGQLEAQMTPVSAIAQMLAQQLGRPVVDKTGIEGSYDFSLQWTPDETQRGAGFGGMDRPATETPLPADTSGPSIFTAVQEQLGLKLESAKGPVEILVIERVEKASGN